MRAMPLTVSWGDLALRLILTVIAGALIGLNRDEHGRPAGLRTTLLVCLAASVAMLQTNILLPTADKPPGSFITMDLMRLPLGILSGIGFIGAGAILRRPNLVIGVTTAATLWMVTVIGLCFGGGQFILGILATAIALAVLHALKRLEMHIRQDRRASLVLVVEAEGPTFEDLAGHLHAAGMWIAGQSVTYSEQARWRETHYDVRWRGLRGHHHPPGFLAEFAARPGVRRLQWSPQGNLAT